MFTVTTRKMDGHYIEGKFNWLNISLLRVANGADMEKAERSTYRVILDKAVPDLGVRILHP